MYFMKFWYQKTTNSLLVVSVFESLSIVCFLSCVAWTINEISERSVGSVSYCNSYHRHTQKDATVYKTLVPCHATYVFYDCTHDNQVPNEIYTPSHSLANAAAVAMTNCISGSTRGYDELIPRRYDIAMERRLFYDYSLKSNDQKQRESNASYVFKTTLGLTLGCVDVLGSWDNWKKPLPMNFSVDGWYLPFTLLDLFPSGIFPALPEIEYKFRGDGRVWLLDPTLEVREGGAGILNNVFRFKKTNTPRDWTPSQELSGIMEPRRLLNRLHCTLAEKNFYECTAEVLGDDILLMQRHDPKTHRFYMAYIHTAFSTKDALQSCFPFSHQFIGRVDRVILEASLHVPHWMPFEDDPSFINGLPSVLHYSDAFPRRTTSTLRSFKIHYNSEKNLTTLQFTTFPPGSVFVFLTCGHPEVPSLVSRTLSSLSSLFSKPTDSEEEKEFELQAFSIVLYSSSAEELQRSDGARGCYHVPMYGDLCYAGLAGVIPVFDTIRYKGFNQTIHPLIQNIVQGNWLFDFQQNRLSTSVCDTLNEKVVEKLWTISQWLDEAMFYPLRCLPRILLAYYMDIIFSTFYAWVIERVLKRMFPGERKENFNDFLCLLSIATLQFYSYIPTSQLKLHPRQATFASGFPHFAVDWMRCWGRDTFIAFRGCFLLPRRFLAAKDVLISYAQVVRHGLLPNLLGVQRTPRYNARDVTWLFLQAVQDYCRVAPEGDKFLTTTLELVVPLESHSPWALECLPNCTPPIQKLSFSELIHYIMYSHAIGISVREFGAGPALDEHMVEEGFMISTYVDKNTGLVYGGNRYNAGTWMDKMGNSKQAGNAGIPATPRDGAAIEINGLVKSALRFVNKLPKDIFPFTACTPDGFTYQEWEKLLQSNVDRLFYMPNTLQQRSLPLKDVTRASYSYKQGGIYRDTLGSWNQESDVQLRPNYCIAQVVASELFQEEHLKESLQIAERELFTRLPVSKVQTYLEDFLRNNGREADTLLKAITTCSNDLSNITVLGMKTLDAHDAHYNGHYYHDNNSKDPEAANGFNYHNGPEWIWPVGYFLRALLVSAIGHPKKSISQKEWRYFLFQSMRHVCGLQHHIKTDMWRSLPELTQKDGDFCAASCQAQAWSIASILCFLFDVIEVENSHVTHA